MKTQRFRVSVKDLFGRKLRMIELDELIGTNIYYEGKAVGTITGYDKSLDTLTGILTDETLFERASFSMEMKGSNPVEIVKY